MASMHWLDYAIFLALLVVSLGIGVYHGCTGGRQKTTAEFHLANRNLKVIPTLISLLVSYQSAILVLGMVAEMYIFGITFWPMYVLSTTISMVIVERLFVPWFYPLKMTSVFEGSIKVGGFAKIYSLANEGGRIFWFPLDLDPRVHLTLWETLFGAVPLLVAAYGVMQCSVQRYCSTSTIQEARRTVLLIIPSIFVTASILAVVGFIVFAYNTVNGCDPLANHEITTGNELFPHFVSAAFADSTGFCGLVLAILYSGALRSPLFGMFLLGGLFRKAEAKGVIAGGIFGIAATMFVNLGSLTVSGYPQTLPPARTDACETPINATETTSLVSLSGISNLYAISFMWYTPLGAGVTMVTGLAVSYVVRFLLPNKEHEEDLPEKLFIPLGNLFCIRDSEDDAETGKCERKEPSLIVQMSATLDTEDVESDAIKQAEIIPLTQEPCHLRRTT
ncbi:hypothetical protein NP493_179g01046 [Ridgeia piscesae]|uniref:Uncharacterized protein n=1 Tax=Ridgeia piscesae TaxID=27915 RepID=A0AAD9P2S5_RIDPI|nr:hypothetical protein NP493_179g01046 [Ridgeia piscesae]